MKNKFTFIICLTFVFLGTTACEKIYHGKVIDADTKESIEGAAVVATWHESTATIAGGSSRFKDVKETLTDKKGEWIIRGPKGDSFIAQVLAMIPGIYYTKTPEFIIFKPSYCSYRNSFRIEACKGRIGPYAIGNGETTKLPKLTKKEDRLRALPSRVSGEGADEKQKDFVRLLNEERKNLGLEKY